MRNSQRVRKKKSQKEAHLGTIFDLGVREEETTLICGNAEGYNFDLGVCE